jgi:hypothetical protein
VAINATATLDAAGTTSRLPCTSDCDLHRPPSATSRLRTIVSQRVRLLHWISPASPWRDWHRGKQRR